MILRRIIAIFVVFLAVPCLWGVKYSIINYQTPDGLPQNQVNALLQGKLGYILIGTQSGIGKFDGQNFQVITKKEGLSHNFITAFAAAKQGYTWIATIDGLSLLNHKSNSIENYLPSTDIDAIALDPKSGAPWIVSASSGIKYLKNQTFHIFDKLPQPKENKDRIKGIYITAAGTRYFYSSSTLFQIAETGEISTITSPAPINTVKQLDEKITIGTANGLFTLENLRLEPLLQLPETMTNVRDFVKDPYQNLWIGTSRGALHYNQQDNRITTITTANGLVNNSVTRILVDRESNVFIGTRNGLSQLSQDFFRMYGSDDRLPSEFAWTFAADNQSILIGGDDGIAQFTNGIIRPLSINKHFKGKSVRAIVKTDENTFLIGTRNRGIFKWSRSKNNLEILHPNAHVLSALKQTNGSVWWGTDNGILAYDGKTFTSYKEGLREKNIWSLAVLDEDTLLVGTGKGLQQLKNQTISDCPLTNQLCFDIINDIHVASPDEILVATQMHGLYIYKDKQILNLTTEDGILHDDVWSVIKDDRGDIWFSTSVSLERYRNGFLSHYNKKTGLVGVEGSLHAVFKSHDGAVYFGFVPGFLEIAPITPRNSEKTKMGKPIIFVNNININNENYELKKYFELEYNKNNIEFRYQGVSTRKENPIYYKTRLFPFEEEWSPSTPDTFIKYLNLPPGRYTFEVKANNGGPNSPWIPSLNKISIDIANPFWLTWWFILLEILSGAALILLIIKIRLNSLEKQKRLLEALVEERTEEIIHKNQELARLSLTDPLTDLKNRRYLEEKIKEDISLIERYIYDSNREPGKADGTVKLLGVFILDIDHFKRVNDLYGHSAGDIVIVEIAQLLLEMLRNSDTIVRWGGEEFLIITRQASMDTSYELAERIRKRIKEHPFKIDDNTAISKTVSIGFAHFPFLPGDISTVTWDQVLSLADSALYTAKRNGRNLTVGVSLGEGYKNIDSREFTKDILSDFETAVENNYIKLVSRKRKYKFPSHKTEKGES